MPIVGLRLQHFHHVQGWATSPSVFARMSHSLFPPFFSFSFDHLLPAVGPVPGPQLRLQWPRHLCRAQLRHCRGSRSQVPRHLGPHPLLGVPRGSGEGRLHPVPGQLRLHGAAAELRRLGGVEVGRALHQINSQLSHSCWTSKPFMFPFCRQVLIGFDWIYGSVVVGSVVVQIN